MEQGKSVHMSGPLAVEVDWDKHEFSVSMRGEEVLRSSPHDHKVSSRRWRLTKHEVYDLNIEIFVLRENIGWLRSLFWGPGSSIVVSRLEAPKGVLLRVQADVLPDVWEAVASRPHLSSLLAEGGEDAST